MVTEFTWLLQAEEFTFPSVAAAAAAAAAVDAAAAAAAAVDLLKRFHPAGDLQLTMEKG